MTSGEAATIKPSVYLVLAVPVLLGLYLEVLPNNLVTGFAVTMTLGGLLSWAGDSIPGVRVYGGAALFCILVPALLVHAGLFPGSGIEIVQSFFAVFLDFLIAALIVGSLLSMNRDLLIQVGVRLIVPVSSAIALAFLVGGLVGHLSGFGADRAILFVVAPIMGGGIGAGAIPMSEIHAAYAGGDAAYFMSVLVPAIMVGNMFCIILAAFLNGLGKREKASGATWLSGAGGMLRRDAAAEDSDDKGGIVAAPSGGGFESIALGILVAGGLYILGHLVASLIPEIHAYAWMIIATGLVKIFDWAPKSVNEGAGLLYGFVSRTWIPAILVAVSVSLIDMGHIVAVVTDPAYIGLTLLTVLSAAFGAGVMGVLVSMYFVESSIIGGLCMADVGGAGDVAVLAASERMHLIPFAQMSSRIGGALMLVIVSVLVPLFG